MGDFDAKKYSKTLAGIFFLFFGLQSFDAFLGSLLVGYGYPLSSVVPFVGKYLYFLSGLIVSLSGLVAGILFLQSSFGSTDSKSSK